ncbi:MAG: glycosyltransferase family 9 protein [bacterium]|nr:glycosyltransferase family 9 protein [bacterium]
MTETHSNQTQAQKPGGSDGAGQTVLVLRFSAVGDVLLTTPALDALKTAWPEARIVYGTKEFIGDMIRHHPAVDEVIGLQKGEGVRDYTRRLKTTGFTVCLDLHDKLRSRMIHMLSLNRPITRWSNRSSLDNAAIWLGLRGRNSYKAPAPTADLFHRAVEKLIGRELPRGRMRYYPGPDDRERARTLLTEAGVDLSKPVIGLAGGANWATKRWPAEYFHELAGRITGAGYQLALNGGPGERELSASIKGSGSDGGRANIFDFTGATLAEMGGIIQHCAAFIANDSGPMHMARALAVPTLGIFGSTDPGMFEYEQQGLAYLEDLECSPCSFYGRKICPKDHFRCMRDLTPDLVWEELQPLLDGKARPYPHA